MTPAKPSLELLRSLTDEHVLRALMNERRLTRAELATRTGISKPTISESVRRLTETGLLVDTGERTTGRGRVGTYFAVADDVGCALVASIEPEGVVAETVDVHGVVTSRVLQEIPRWSPPDRIAAALGAAAGRAVGQAPAPARLAVVSAADPVDRRTGRLIHLPDAPFLVGELAPADVLASMVDGPVTVDNDVNWAARAERDADAGLEDFAYLFLGDGLGCAVVSDGEVRRGHHGLAGEIAHLITRGPDGRAVPFIGVFAVLGLSRAPYTAVDTAAVLRQVVERAPVRRAIADAVCGVLAALVGLTDPRIVVLGGPWGGRPEVVEAVAERFGEGPRAVPVRRARVTDAPSLTAARRQGLADLRGTILAGPPAPRPARTVISGD